VLAVLAVGVLVGPREFLVRGRSGGGQAPRRRLRSWSPRRQARFGSSHTSHGRLRAGPACFMRWARRSLTSTTSAERPSESSDRSTRPCPASATSCGYCSWLASPRLHSL
jgi:hypothetical protein